MLDTLRGVWGSFFSELVLRGETAYFTTRRSIHPNWDGVETAQSLASALRYLHTTVRLISFLSGSMFPKFWFITGEFCREPHIRAEP
jgi:hypothetical protein